MVSPRNITASTILQHVRRGRIHGAYPAGRFRRIDRSGGFGDIEPGGRALRDIHLPAGVMIGAIVRGGRVISPRGNTVIQNKDRVILFATADVVRKVEKLFSVRLGTFEPAISQ